MVATKSPIDFYFDFSSPYGYLAAQRINAVGANHDRRVVWRPILLGAAFKVSGNSPLISQPLKGDYAIKDIPRTARYLRIPYRHPEPFPIGTQNAARAFYWLHDRDPLQAVRFAKLAYATYFAEATDISSAELVATLAAKVGAERDSVLAAVNDPAVKDRLRREVDASVERGVFGSPFFIVDGEAFWGNDRIEQLDAWLQLGGF